MLCLLALPGLAAPGASEFPGSVFQLVGRPGKASGGSESCSNLSVQMTEDVKGTQWLCVDKLWAPIRPLCPQCETWNLMVSALEGLLGELLY